ncbi:hypothetical protein EVAR_8273_1 [Eumeta japonica]|uniref:Uncharacterized protein n=1 Tax=Eumeta variegata TaxID=151549 RepID=A0A4C1TFV7_EUMVA|nr:hypothetical protein EVAR_8273_1 [Eumeta japonica]
MAYFPCARTIECPLANPPSYIPTIGSHVLRGRNTLHGPTRFDSNAARYRIVLVERPTEARRRRCDNDCRDRRLHVCRATKRMVEFSFALTFGLDLNFAFVCNPDPTLNPKISALIATLLLIAFPFLLSIIYGLGPAYTDYDQIISRKRIIIRHSVRNSAAVKLVTKSSQWHKIDTRGTRRKGREALNLRIASFAGERYEQSSFENRELEFIDAILLLGTSPNNKVQWGPYNTQVALVSRSEHILKHTSKGITRKMIRTASQDLVNFGI